MLEFEVPLLGKACLEEFVGNDPCHQEAIYALPYFHIHIATFGYRVDVLLILKLLWKYMERHIHVFEFW